MTIGRTEIHWTSIDIMVGQGHNINPLTAGAAYICVFIFY